jgi:hypothetical protein
MGERVPNGRAAAQAAQERVLCMVAPWTRSVDKKEV